MTIKLKFNKDEILRVQKLSDSFDKDKIAREVQVIDYEREFGAIGLLIKSFLLKTLNRTELIIE